MIQTIARLARPQTLLVVVIRRAAGHVFHAVEVPDKNLFAVRFLQRIPARCHRVEMVLVKRNTDERMVHFLHDCVRILEAVNRHGRAAAKFDGQLDAMRLDLFDHFAEHCHCIRSDVVQRRRNGQIHRRNDDNHLTL